MANRIVRINRAPVLTLWAAVVAGRLGFDQAEALTLGKAVGGLAVAGLNAYSDWTASASRACRSTLPVESKGNLSNATMRVG